jgi:FMN-dependent NADH-azoreductase
MTKILYLTSSPRGEDSYSNRAARELIADIKRRDPAARVIHRDLAADPLPHIDADFVAATRGPNGPQTPAQRDGAARSDALIDELLAADTIVISAGMINFGIPSTLKAWIDHVARPGRTFSYASGAPEGLVKNKKVILVVATGGDYSGAGAAMDFQVPYLRHVLGFLGMSDVEVFTVAGTAYGPDAAAKAVEATRQTIHRRCNEIAAAA